MSKRHRETHTGDLFSHALERDPGAIDPASTPLAERMRPRLLDDLIGQEKVLGKGTPLRLAIERDRVPSLLLWGPPGCGKTTFARLLASCTRARFVPFHAVLGGVQEIRAIVDGAREARAHHRTRTMLFVDEI